MSRLRGDDGSTTVELAIALPAVLALLVFVLAAGAGAVAKIQCSDAARAGSRQAALGKSPEQVEAAARQAVSPDAQVEVQELGGGWAEVVVSQRVGILDRLGMDGWVESRSRAYLEPWAGGP